MAGLKHLFDIIALNIEHQMEIERTCGKIVETCADELRAVRFNRRAQNLWHASRQGRGRLIYKRQNKRHAPV